MASSELREIYRALQAEHVAMRTQLEASMREFKRAFKKVRPRDEAELTTTFQQILEALLACRKAARPIAREILK
jgi:hypothetical protein